MAFRFCKYCNTEHPLTEDYWKRLNYRPNSPTCRRQAVDTRAKWLGKNREKMREASLESYYRRKEKVIARQNHYCKKKRKTDPLFRLTTNIRSRLNKAIRGKIKSGSSIRHLGCTVKDLKLYLESKFTEGMSWDNYGRTGWHVDHIIPLSQVNLGDPVEFKKVVHYTNLQPLWAKDNIIKGNK